MDVGEAPQEMFATMKTQARAMPVGLLALACATALVGCATAPRPNETTGQALDDSVITSKVKAALIVDPQTEARDIHVTTYRGVVQLAGFVNSKAESNDAKRIAAGTTGVRHVDDELRIAQHDTVGAAVDDTRITAKVKATLLANPGTRADIHVTTRQGVVQLYGFVNSRAQRHDAARVAMSVQGVRKVVDGLQLKPLP
jgi:hyperosmotically inducible protein